MTIIIDGSNTPTLGGVGYGDGTELAFTGAGSAGGVLYSAGGAAPAFTAAGTSGQVLQSNGASAPTWATATSAGFTLGTPVATTSGTSINFTGIPAGTKQIVINFADVSTNSASQFLIQIGDSGGIETTSYKSRYVSFASGGTAQFDASSSGYINGINVNQGSATLAYGSITLTLENATSFTWVATGTLFDFSNAECSMNAGFKSLSAVLDRVRITTVSGTAVFDNGEINIAYI